jgi:hypothetical protein
MKPGLALPLFGLALSACSIGKPFNPALQGRSFYLCCNLRFNQDNDATDANYQYPLGGTTLPVGTRVKVVEVGAHAVRLSPEAGGRTFDLELRFGREQITADEYFRNILREVDSRPTLENATPEIRAAVREGNLMHGMTKEQALMARGYPPAHHTPSTSADEWLYYQSGGFVTRVRFVGGKIDLVETIPAP